jgi:hypothetical protein
MQLDDFAAQVTASVTCGRAVARSVASGPIGRWVLIAAIGLAAASARAEEAAVHVDRQGGTVIIDVDMTVPAKTATAWAVLTDYDRMATFLSNLTSSKIIDRRGDTLVVAQAGSTKVAFMTFGFAVVRAVELVPMDEIRSSLVSGDFESYVSTTRLTGTTGDVRVRHHGEYVPKAWLPPMVGVAVIESETRKQYAEFAAEMVRRESSPGR